MVNKRNIAKVFIISFLMSVILDQATQAHAQGRDERRRDFYYTPHYTPHGREVHALPHGYIRLIMGGLEYYYWEGMFYRMTADRYLVVPAPIGAVVTTIPQGCQPVVIDGIPYYTINGVTYMYTTMGYQVVPEPKTIVIKNYTVDQKASVNTPIQNVTSAEGASTTTAEESFTVNVPNAKGGYTAVTLKRAGNGFIGPQGEYYTEFPKIEQLKAMYAK